mmetsp:Transcript_114706/g.370677  ORF Transcript_114706/g.370677 Transcript_114706/m.370677 type:complete len:310 (+) Transcript_114706:2-931(+)
MQLQQQQPPLPQSLQSPRLPMSEEQQQQKPWYHLQHMQQQQLQQRQQQPLQPFQQQQQQHLHAQQQERGPFELPLDAEWDAELQFMLQQQSEQPVVKQPQLHQMQATLQQHQQQLQQQLQQQHDRQQQLHKPQHRELQQLWQRPPQQWAPSNGATWPEASTDAAATFPAAPGMHMAAASGEHEQQLGQDEERVCVPMPMGLFGQKDVGPPQRTGSHRRSRQQAAAGHTEDFSSGMPVSRQIFCRTCGNTQGAGHSFCSACGGSLAGPQMEGQPYSPDQAPTLAWFFGRRSDVDGAEMDGNASDVRGGWL